MPHLPFDPVFLIALPAVLGHSMWMQKQRALARAAAMRRHPSSRRG